MTTRTRPAGDRTRERIVDVALPLFAQHGFAGTSVRTIATAADVNVATLAYHFQDKAGLYDTVVQRLHEDLIEHFPEVVPAGTPETLLRYWIDRAWRFSRDHAPHLRLLLRHVLDHGEQPQVNIDRFSEGLLARADAIITPFRPNWTSTRRRLLILSVSHLTVRLVLEDRTQLARMVKAPLEQLDETVVDWLCEFVLRELGLET